MTIELVATGASLADANKVDANFTTVAGYIEAIDTRIDGLGTPTSASGSSAAVNILDFGAVCDGLTDDTVAFQAAIAALPNGGTILVPMAKTVISEALVANVPVLMKADGVRGDISSNTNGSGFANAGPIIRWDGAVGEFMFTVEPANIGDVVWGGGSAGIEWDGGSKAAAGVHLNNTKYAYFDGKFRNVLWKGLVVSSMSGNTSNFSMKNHIPSIEFVWGTDEACKPAGGLLLMGNWTDVPATQQYIGDISGLVYDGDLVDIQATDNAQFRSVHSVTQSGGTGVAMHIQNNGAQPSSHTHIGYAVGHIKTETGVVGTKIEHYNSEAGTISGSGKWDGELIDYVTGEVFKSHTYSLRKKIELTAAAFRGNNTATADFALQWTTLTFPEGVTSIASLIMPPPYDMGDGVIEGVEVLFGSNNTNTGNTKLELRMSAAANGTSTAAVTPEKVQAATVAFPGQYVQGSYTFAFSPELGYTKGDTLYLSIRRLGTDAADTQTQAIHLLGARILYRGTGPASAGSGTYNIPQW